MAGHFGGIFSSPSAAHMITAPMHGTDMAFPAMRVWAVLDVSPSLSITDELSRACFLVTGRQCEESASSGSR